MDRYSVEMWDKGMIHIPGQTEQDGERFHRTTQKGMNLKLMNFLFLEFSI